MHFSDINIQGKESGSLRFFIDLHSLACLVVYQSDTDLQEKTGCVLLHSATLEIRTVTQDSLLHLGEDINTQENKVHVQHTQQSSVYLNNCLNSVPIKLNVYWPSAVVQFPIPVSANSGTTAVGNSQSCSALTLRGVSGFAIHRVPVLVWLSWAVPDLRGRNVGHWLPPLFFCSGDQCCGLSSSQVISAVVCPLQR